MYCINVLRHFHHPVNISLVVVAVVTFRNLTEIYFRGFFSRPFPSFSYSLPFVFPSLSPPHIASSNLAKRFGGALLPPTEEENDICSLASTLLVYLEPGKCVWRLLCDCLFYILFSGFLPRCMECNAVLR